MSKTVELCDYLGTVGEKQLKFGIKLLELINLEYQLSKTCAMCWFGAKHPKCAPTTCLSDLIDKKRNLLEKSLEELDKDDRVTSKCLRLEEEIDSLKSQNEKLESLVRSLTTQLEDCNIRLCDMTDMCGRLRIEIAQLERSVQVDPCMPKAPFYYCKVKFE